MSTTAQQKTWLGKLIAEIGEFFGSLFNGAKKAFNSLSHEQQQALINGVNVSQIIKEGYAKGEAYVVAEIAKVTGLSADVITPLILSIAKDAGINVTSVQAYLDAIANKVQAGITDNGWNNLFSDIASFAASWLSTGTLNWASLAIGLVEFAYQHFLAAKKA